ncbi:MAG: hypothetical protein AB7U30_06675 [Sulfuricellaceae bacterium]|jgi:hypothetical protein
MGKHLATLARLGTDALLFALLALGIGSVVYALVAPDEGWLALWLEQLWHRAPTLILPLMAVLAVLFFFFKPRLDNLNLRERTGNLLMVGWALLGLIVGLHWLSAAAIL